MSFIKSALYGDSGNYHFLGIDLTYKKDDDDISSSLEGAGKLSTFAIAIHQNPAFRVLTQGYFHVNIHEFGHALAIKLLLPRTTPKVIVQIDSCTGYTEPPPEYEKLSPWKQTFIDAAGPLANIAFSSCKIAAAAALKNYLTWPISLAIAGGAAIWITGELLYATLASQRALLAPSIEQNGNKLLASTSESDDFYNITQRGKAHLAAAATALLTTLSLGIFAAAKFLA